MKEGDIIINPHYHGFETDESDTGYMLCRIEKIFAHKARRGGIAYRLVTIKGGNFIVNASEKELRYAQETKSYIGPPYKHSYLND